MSARLPQSFLQFQPVSGQRKLCNFQTVKGRSGRISFVMTVDRPGTPRQTLRLGDARNMTLEEAKAKALLVEKSLFGFEDQTPVSTQIDKNPTFSAFITHYYRPFIQKKQRSIGSTESYLRNWIEPYLGEMKLHEIQKSDLQCLIRSMELAGLKPGSINRAVNIIKSCFSKALEWGIGSMSISPAKGLIDLPDPASKERFLSEDEANRLITTVKQSRNSMLYPIVGFLLMTGARRSEVLNAQWGHIDFTRKIWRIPLSKSGKPRRIPLSDSALYCIAEARKRLNLVDNPKSDDIIFANPRTGQAFVNVFNAWDKAREMANLKDVRLHDLRHSFASALVNNGLNIYDVKELLGHSSVQTTQRYAHLSDERLSDATTIVANHFSIEKK